MSSREFVVTPEVLAKTLEWKCEECASKFLHEREPLLCEFFDAEVERIAGRMSLSGAPSSAVSEVSTAFRLLCARMLYALDTGHRIVWEKELLAPISHSPGQEEGGIA